MEEVTLKELLDRIQKLTESKERLRVLAKQALMISVNVAKSIGGYDAETEAYAKTIAQEIDDL